jgi:putative peptide zinc metalloprotease protein
MADTTETFSESWYRVANQKISLRHGVTTRRQNFRGERWIILENPLSNQFYRLRPEAYDFIARLRPDRTVEEVWKESLDRSPDTTPGQEAVLHLLAQLYFANLLQYDLASDSARLFERYQKTKQRETRSRWMNIMFIRVPLFDPDEFLKRTLPFIGKFISPFGALLWFLVVGWGIKIAVDNAALLKNQSEGVLAPDNLFLLYVGMVMIKTLHEFGHAYFCKKFGGEVHVMGVMFMIFTPTPYMDATSSWGFRSRWQRMLVGAAGMIVELFFAAIATFIWAKTKPGALHSVAYNIMFIASVSTLLFNLIPLLRFDGYYILSDWLDIPNLHQRSMKYMRYLVEHYAFGLAKVESPTQSKKEAWWLGAFGVSSGIYRVFVFGRVLLFVADRLLLIGIIMAVVCAISWVMVPTVRLFRYLGSDPKLDRHRPRAIAVVSATACVLVILLQVVPFPYAFRAPGVLEAKNWAQMANNSAGQLAAVIVPSGTIVKAGQPLLQLRNEQLDLEIAAAEAAYAEGEARILQARRGATANVQPLQSRQEAISKRLLRLRTDRDSLTLRARQDGRWIAPQVKDSVGRWLGRGTPLGLIVDEKSFEFVATVVQEDVDNLFSREIVGAEVKLFGQANRPMTATNLRKIPAEQRNLPSPALGWGAGGEIPIAKTDPKGEKAAEPFFAVHADITAADGITLMHGRAGKIRFELPSEPLLPRWVKRFRQLIQKRYQL